MAEQKLLVKREGDFHYPIYFKNDFQDLAGAIRDTFRQLVIIVLAQK